MYLVLLLTAAALLADTCRSANVNKHMKLLSELNDRIDANAQTKPSVNGARRFLAITHRPDPSYAHTPGSIIELGCEAIGAPAPSIHWFKNDAPVYEYDIESNELIDTNPSSVARITSTLFVTRTSSEDVYTCLVTAGSKTATASTTLYNIGGSTELSERSKLYPLKPRIVVFYKIYVDTIGNNIVLPCRAKGHPKPHVTWFDNFGAAIKKNPRMKVLRSGELVIKSLRWPDMGEFTCHATNMFGTQIVKTFIYPAKAD